MYLNEFELRNRLNQEITRRFYMQRELEKSLEENHLLRKRIDSLKRENESLRDEAVKYTTSLKKTENKFQEQINILENENERFRDLLEEIGYGKKQ